MNQHFTVKELPESEKPYEKCLRFGAGHLSDAELLAVIIRTGTAGRQSIEVAQEILNYKEKSLLNLYRLSIKELCGTCPAKMPCGDHKAADKGDTRP